MYPKLIILNALLITIYYTVNYTEFYDYHQKNSLFEYYHDHKYSFFKNYTITI